MSCSVALEEDSPDYYLLKLTGKFDEGIQHLFLHYRNKLAKEPKTTYIDLSEILVLKEKSSDDLFSLLSEVERQEIEIHILKAAPDLIPLLQKEQYDELLMTPEALTEKGFTQYLDEEGKLPYTFPLPPLPKPEKKARSKAAEPFFEEPPPKKRATSKKRTSSTTKSTSNAAEQLLSKILLPPQEISPESNKKKFTFSFAAKKEEEKN